MMKIIQFDCKPAARTSVQAVAKPCLLPGLLIMATLIAFILPAAFAQAIPAAEASPISTGFALPLTAGTLQYAVSASESLTWGYYGNSGASASTNLTGDVAYISNSRRDPFSMVVAAGRSWATSGQSSYSYLNGALSQVISAGRWSIVLSDDISYLPGTATTGLSGIAGVGDLGVNPVQVGLDTGQGVLSNYSRRITNTAAASIQRQLTGKTAAHASGDYSLSHFLDNNSGNLGLDNTYANADGGITHSFNRRDTLGGDYAYTTYDYGSSVPSFSSQTASLMFTHQYSRKISLSAAAGPQWTTISGRSNATALSLFVTASANYSERFSHFSLGYIRSSNSGYGVLGGAISDSISLSASRTFARVWNGALTSEFSRTTNLPQLGTTGGAIHTYVEGAQISRAIARSLSIYAGYTLEDQSNLASGNTVNTFSGVTNVLGFGITYSPMSMHFGRP
jgi:hypothetical protein